MNEVYVVIAGTILGFLLSSGGAYFSETRNRQQQIRSVRAIVRFELGWNLQRLQTIMTRLNPQQQPMEDASQQRYLAEALVSQTGLKFSREMFQSQLNLISTALTAQEITVVFALFDQFAQLEQIQTTLRHYQQEERQAYSNYALPTAGSPPRLQPARPFSEHAAALWHEYDAVARPMLQQGNPL